MVSDLIQHPAINLITANAGSPARARNTLLDYAENNEYVQWVARLDADDQLATPNSVEVLWKAGKKYNASYVIGSNLLKHAGKIQDALNIAESDVLLNRNHLIEFIEAFCSGQQKQELPSCNLLLKTHITLRYPNIRSAEDHWLLTRLLMLYPEQAAVVSTPNYAIYTLSGNDTNNNKNNEIWQTQRKRLAEAARCWYELKSQGITLLGVGLEGAVWQQENTIIKRFYSWSISDLEVDKLQSLLSSKTSHLPIVQWFKQDGFWHYSTPAIKTHPMKKTESEDAIIAYLVSLYRAGICTSNVKRDNILVKQSGELFYIDIGKDIHPLSSSHFLDMAARLYAIAILGLADEEFVRRHTWLSQSQALRQLKGFETFYKDLIHMIHTDWLKPYPKAITAEYQADDVSLLIKCCAQDAKHLLQQITHIVTQLNYPAAFKEVLLLVDPYQGPFLREYDSSDYELLLENTAVLKRMGIIHQVIIAPEDNETIQSTYQAWFNNRAITHTHTIRNAPLFPQIWAFDQVKTPYVLQCDSDILIGRKDFNHDYLADMLSEIKQERVLAVGFNIPQPSTEFEPYFGEPGQFAPEVRFGLLDMTLLRQQLPIKNPIENQRFTLTWHRAFQRHQADSGLTSLRGGDPKTFYIHPQNKDKHLNNFHLLRDLIGQGFYPQLQAGYFDLLPEADWQYPKRTEEIVFLLKGRNTCIEKLTRCLNSLKSQINQKFGLVLIDDASGYQHSWCFTLILSELMDRTTLIRREQHCGRMPNFIEGIKDICTNPDTLIVVLDQDDYLLNPHVVDDLYMALEQGADLIQMPMFRPNKPLKLYQENYQSPRQNAGGNVWSHLRSFKKSLFEQVPEDYFKHQGKWFDTVTDYATMLPIAEIAKKPMYVDNGYAYYHERQDYGHEKKDREHQLIAVVLNKPSLTEAPAHTTPTSDGFLPLHMSLHNQTTTS